MGDNGNKEVPVSISPRTWHHIASTFDGNTKRFRVYFDCDSPTCAPVGDKVMTGQFDFDSGIAESSLAHAHAAHLLKSTTETGVSTIPLTVSPVCAHSSVLASLSAAQLSLHSCATSAAVSGRPAFGANCTVWLRTRAAQHSHTSDNSNIVKFKSVCMATHARVCLGTIEAHGGGWGSCNYTGSSFFTWFAGAKNDSGLLRPRWACGRSARHPTLARVRASARAPTCFVRLQGSH